MSNQKERRPSLLLLALFCVAPVMAGCGGGSAATMANPAADKCLQDGFTLEPIVVDGVTRDTLCVDPKSGKKCEVWRYYRYECTLDPPAIPNPAADKCLRDGYQLKTIEIDGVPRGAHCIDPRSGKSCEVWEYYRGECTLPPAQSKEH